MPRPNETTHHQILPLGSDPKLRHRFMVLDEPLQGNLRFGLLLEVLGACRTFRLFEKRLPNFSSGQ
jgi:hypothetical protein